MNDIDSIYQNDCNTVESFEYLPKKLPVKRLGKEFKKIAGYVKISDLARVNDLFAIEEMASHADISASDLKLHVGIGFRDLDGGKISMEIDISQDVMVTCQRCNETMSQVLNVAMKALLVNSSKVVIGQSYADFEKIEINRSGLFDFHEVLEDEIILSLPAVMKHDESDEKCKDFSNFCI